MKHLLASFGALALLASGAQADWEINVSGSNGQNAPHGRDGIAAGGDGTHAGQSTSGQRAGRIAIRMVDQGSGLVGITGTHSQTLDTGVSGGRLRLKANGGKGGDGGNGGDGATGSTGSRGRDATRSSSGSNGGSGGRGGDGGNGSSGSNGSDGGEITVTVEEKDMHLLYLLATPEVSGGAAGTGGRNGSGGSGGQGGPGGSSYSWQESYTDTCSSTCPDTCTGSKTVSGANGSSTTVTYTYSCTKSCSVSCTKYRTESNSGGSQGSSGSSGSDGRASITNGVAGRDGSYKFVVEYKDGRVVSYSTPFELIVTDFQLATDFSDAFVQPGEKMKLSSITLNNRGGMPSPTLTALKIRADGDAMGAINTAPFLNVRTSIPPGGSLVISGPIETDILRSFLTLESAGAARPKNEMDSGPRGGPVKNFKIGVSTEIVGINRLSPRFTAAKPLTVQYPVSISRVLGKRSVGKGDEYPIRWSLANRAKSAVGAESGSHQKVRVRSSFAFVSPKAVPQGFSLEMRNADEKNPGVQQISLLDARVGPSPKESNLLWAKLGFSSQAKVFDEGYFKILVEVEDPYLKGTWHPVDVQFLKVKVGMEFAKTPGASALLVTNPETTDEEVKAWTELLESLDRRFDIWDAGTLGALDITRNGIAEHYAGGTIIVLNDLMKQSGEEAVPADALFKLAPPDFISVAKQNKIGVMVLDRTGSYKIVAGERSVTGSSSKDSPMLVAVKVTEEKFKSPEYIKSDFNKLSVSMAMSFEQKLAGFAKLSRSKRKGAMDSAKTLLEAIISDLAIERVYARTAGSRSEKLELLALTIEEDALAMIGGEEIIARMRLLNSAGESSNLADQLLAQFQKKLDHSSEEAIQKRVAELESQARKIELQFIEKDTTRFWKFPRKWNGNYYRLAIDHLILAPVKGRTYTSEMELFDLVLEKERQVRPAFH